MYTYGIYLFTIMINDTSNEVIEISMYFNIQQLFRYIKMSNIESTVVHVLNLCLFDFSFSSFLLLDKRTQRSKSKDLV